MTLTLLMLTAAPPLLVRVAVFEPLVWPKDTLPQVMEEGETVSAIEELAPVPDKATVSGVEELLLVMFQLAERAPDAVGLKTMLAVQLAEAARVDPQLVEETAKSEALVPVMPALLRVTELEAPFVTVMVCVLLDEPVATLPNDKVVGARVTLPVPPVPRPNRATCCGLLPAPSVKLSVAVRVPETVGLNRIVTVQLAEAARVDPQVCW